MGEALSRSVDAQEWGPQSVLQMRHSAVTVALESLKLGHRA